MTDVDVTVSVPAAASRLSASIVQLVKDAKDKKPLATIAADVLPLIVAAVQDIGELGNEVSDPQMPVLAGLMAGQIAQALMGKPIPAPAPVAPSI